VRESCVLRVYIHTLCVCQCVCVRACVRERVVCFECIYTHCACVREGDKESLYVCERDNEESLCVGVCVLRVRPGLCICRRHPDLYVFVCVCVCLYVCLCVRERVCACV